MSFCSKCGQQMQQGTRYCPGCGTATTGPAYVAPVPPPTTGQTLPAATSAAHGARRPRRRLLVLLATIGLLVAAGVGGAFAIQKSQTEKYPEAVRTTFVQQCQGNGGNYSYCTCTLSKLEARYSFAEYKRLEARLLVGQVPTEVTDLIADCE